MDLHELKPHVARTQVPNGHAGSAFLIAADCLLTCVHCLTRNDGSVADKVNLNFADWDQDQALQATVEWQHPRGWDIALLRLQRSTSLSGLHLASAVRADEPFVCWGYPSPAVQGERLDGTVADPAYNSRLGRILHLKCDEAREAVHGLSGSPVLVEGAVVGMMSMQLMRPADNRHPPRPAFGTLYALPMNLLAGTPVAALVSLRTRATPPLGAGTLHGMLSRLNQGQIAQVARLFGVPQGDRPSDRIPMRQQANEILSYAEQVPDGIARLEACMRTAVSHMFEQKG